MTKMKYINLVKMQCILVTATLFFGCAAPRDIVQSGKVTPHKQIRLGFNYAANIPTETVASIYDEIESAVEKSIKNDTTLVDDAIIKANKSAYAYALDPIGFGMEFYLRYGILRRFDIGYKYNGGINIFDARYQFLGSTGNCFSSDNNENGSRMYGSIGIQYSSQKYALPGKFETLQEAIGIEFKRKDILIPLCFSKSFGPEEKIGNLSFGLAYNLTFLDYGFDPKNVLEYVDAASSNTQTILSGFHAKKNISSFGAFINVKVGYKFVYFLPSLSVYYQDYGSFTLINGESQRFKGFTFVPSLGFQFNLPPFKCGKNKK